MNYLNGIKHNGVAIKLCRLLMFQKRHTLVVPNAHIYAWESDVFSVTQSFLSNEYEIKMNYRDYLRDFEEKKHKHKMMEVRYDDHTKYPARFCFVVHCDILDKVQENLPEYSGLMSFEPRLVRTYRKRKVGVVKEYTYLIKEHKRQPFIHREKIDPYHLSRLIRNFGWRFLKTNQYI